MVLLRIREFHPLRFLVGCWFLSISAATASMAADQPNIVFILADDLGYGDLGCYGHPKAKTPNIDRLAREGVMCTQHYANGPECSPTRTAFLTGKYQQRAGGLECAIGTGNVGRYDKAIRLANQRELGLPAKQTVIPGQLKAAGYKCGIFGKWHLGYEPKFNPMEHGWDEFRGYLGGNVHYFNHRETSDLHVLFNGRLPVYRKGYMTKLITDDAIAFLEKHKTHPIFLYVSHECPHFPFQGPSDQDKVITEENWQSPDQSTYIAMLEDLDQEVGRLLAAVEKAALRENTIVVFVSDNGGYGPVSHVGSLRGAKSTTFEGGIRVPLIVRWPNKIAAGTTSEQVSATFDLTYSFLKLAGVNVEPLGLDGVDVLQAVRDKNVVKRPLFWRGKRGDRTWSAVREDDWKYVKMQESDRTDEYLFNLAKDRTETRNLLDQYPEKVTALKMRMTAWERDVQPVR